MEQLVSAALCQGFTVRRGKRGAWVFAKGSLTVTEVGTPSTAAQWARLAGALRGVGLVLPAETLV